jgi:nitrite reductase (NADH) small subunit
MNGWIKICELDDIAPKGSRVVASEQGDIALFRTDDNRVFALYDKCPHKGGPLSQGMVHGDTVSCPLHGWKIDLSNGVAMAPDKGCAKSVEVRLEDGSVWLALK